jgi:hypothetical protein
MKIRIKSKESIYNTPRLIINKSNDAIDTEGSSWWLSKFEYGKTLDVIATEYGYSIANARIAQTTHVWWNSIMVEEIIEE